MKPRTATLVSLALAAFGGNRLVDAAKHTSEVTYEGVTFNIAYFDDGRKRPYRIRFKEDGVTHRFFFKRRNILVKWIKSGTEKYRIYHRSRNLYKVVRRDSGARLLLDDAEDPEYEEYGEYEDEDDEEFEEFEGEEEDEDDKGEDDEETSFGDWGVHQQRRLYACEDCEETWEEVCETSDRQGGVGSVCELVDYYDDPIADLGQQGIDIMCDKFLGACNFFSAADACAGQCEGNTPGETVKCCKRSDRRGRKLHLLKKMLISGFVVLHSLYIGNILVGRCCCYMR